MRKRKYAKKGQSWTIEFILAFLIFISAVVLSIKIISNVSHSSDFEDLMKDSELLSNGLLSSGYPDNWTTTNVILPGIVTDNRINISKLFNLTVMDYYSARQLFGINHDFFIYFENSSGTIDIFEDFGMAGKCGYGSPSVTIVYNGTCMLYVDEEYDNLVTLSRFTIYEHKIIKMTIYVWD